MAQSQLALYNLALSIMGSDYTVASLTEQSIPNEVCNLWYENTRLTVFRAAHWKSCKRYARLVKANSRETETGYTSDSDLDWQSTDPEPGFAFSYLLPERCVAPRYLSDFGQFDVGVNSDSGQDILSCNYGGAEADDAPILCYTYDQTNPVKWEPDLYKAMAYALASQIAMPITGKPKKTELIFGVANQIILEARASTANEMHMRQTQLPEQLQARGYLTTYSAPYVYPYGSLLTGTGASVV